jgi:hypothetical protein
MIGVREHPGEFPSPIAEANFASREKTTHRLRLGDLLFFGISDDRRVGGKQSAGCRFVNGLPGLSLTEGLLIAEWPSDDPDRGDGWGTVCRHDGVLNFTFFELVRAPFWEGVGIGLRRDGVVWLAVGFGGRSFGIGLFVGAGDVV